MSQHFFKIMSSMEYFVCTLIWDPLKKCPNIKGWTPFPHRGGGMSPFLVDSIGHNLGLGCRRSSKFFCYGLWTHSGPLGVRPAPKSICTHQAHPSKLLAQENTKIGQFRPIGHSAAWRPRWASEIKNVFKRVLWTLNHLLGCLDDVSHRLWKNIFALEKSSKVTFSPKSLLGLYCTKM